MIRKEIKAYIKRMVKERIYTLKINDKTYNIIKYTDNKFAVCVNDTLILDLIDYKIYTRHNLINLIENEKEPNK